MVSTARADRAESRSNADSVRLPSLRNRHGRASWRTTTWSSPIHRYHPRAARPVTMVDGHHPDPSHTYYTWSIRDRPRHDAHRRPVWHGPPSHRSRSGCRSHCHAKDRRFGRLRGARGSGIRHKVLSDPCRTTWSRRCHGARLAHRRLGATHSLALHRSPRGPHGPTRGAGLEPIRCHRVGFSGSASRWNWPRRIL